MGGASAGTHFLANNLRNAPKSGGERRLRRAGNPRYAYRTCTRYIVYAYTRPILGSTRFRETPPTLKKSLLTVQVAKLRYKLYTNVSDFTGNRTVPSMDNSNAARVPSPPLLRVLYRIVKYEYSYCKVLYLPYYRIEPTTVPTVLRFPLLTTYEYYLQPAT